MTIDCPECHRRIPSISTAHDSSEDEYGDSLVCSACGMPVESPVKVDHLQGIGADQLLLRGMISAAPGSGEWDVLEANELSETLESRYDVQSLLGQGGMGAVYLVWDKQLARSVAIKILPAEMLEEEEAVARFEREARAMASLDHPNIIKIYDFGQTADGSPYVIMEHAAEGDLQHLLANNKLNLPEALNVISQVCAGLEHAHKKGVIHRDIKPSNILIDADGNPKIADFGLAKFVMTELQMCDHPKLTMTGQVMGTPEYMAPEQQAGKSADHRSDIFALGSILFKVLTGNTPASGWSPPSEKNAIDTRLDDIIVRSLKVNPQIRYQSASELKMDIDTVASQTGGAALAIGEIALPLPSSQNQENQEEKSEANDLGKEVKKDSLSRRLFQRIRGKKE